MGLYEFVTIPRTGYLPAILLCVYRDSAAARKLR